VIMEDAERTVLPLQDLLLEELPSGCVHELWLKLPLGLLSDLCLPALVIKGTTPRSILLVTAGVHGDEFEGMVAIPKLVRSLDPGTLAGTVVGLPICNPLAFEAQSRQSPPAVDGKNLAREFPGQRAGTPTQRLAAELFSLVRRLLGPDDLFVDLHSGGSRYRYLPMVGYRDIDVPSRKASEEAARHFGSGRLWIIDDDPGTFNSEISRVGIPTIGTESTGQGGCRPEDVADYVRGLCNLLRYRGMILGAQPVVREDGPARQPTQIHASTSGLFLTHTSLGHRVTSGEVIGEVLSPFGSTLERLTAPHAGQVWALRVFGTIRAGDMAAWIACS
jgi:predicted deacylase